MTTLQDIVNKWQMPEISEETLTELVKQIKPVVVNPKNNKLYYIQEVNVTKTSFTFEPVFTKKAKKLKKIGIAFSLHSSYPGLWKPSMKEILSFIQDHPYIEYTVAVSVEFLGHHHSGNGNIGIITLYGKK